MTLPALNKRLAAVLIAAGLLLALLIAFVMASSSAPTVQPTPPPLVPSATPTPVLPDPYEQAIENDDQYVNDFRANFPVVQRLPFSNTYWSLQVAGALVGGKLPLKATIFIPANASKDEVVAKQTGYINQWITKTGQKPGTYVLNITTQDAHFY